MQVVEAKHRGCYTMSARWRRKEEREEANKQALQHLHQQGGQEGLHTILVKEEENDKVVAIKVNKQANNGVKRF